MAHCTELLLNTVLISIFASSTEILVIVHIASIFPLYKILDFFYNLKFMELLKQKYKCQFYNNEV